MRNRLVPAIAVGVLAAAAFLPMARADDSAAATIGILDVTGVAVNEPSEPTPLPGDGIGPGSPILIDFIDGGTSLCTANFVWQDASTGTSYLGAAGHCFLPGPFAPVGDEDYDDAEIGSNQWVAGVRVCVSRCVLGGQSTLETDGMSGDFVPLGAVVYARQSADKDGDDAIGKDFGVVTIPPELTVAPYLRPAVPVWGGASGTSSGNVGVPTCVYGNAVGLGEVVATKARAGLGLPDLIFDDPGAWFAALPSLPGDSGSGVVECATRAGIGALTHVTANGVAGTTLGRAVFMAQEAGLSLLLIDESGQAIGVAPVPYTPPSEGGGNGGNGGGGGGRGGNDGNGGGNGNGDGNDGGGGRGKKPKG